MARKPDLPSLKGQPWLEDVRLQNLLHVLGAEGEARVAGGAVRNALLGEPVADVDVATTLKPSDVSRLCRVAGFGVHPTGIDHGTVTITVERHPFEVTTLRRDVETDGRRAVVSFTDEWVEDAERRDFTINAMYCDGNGKIYDFTNGYEDILKRRVKFVGTASLRIKEDYLRILRFFRFHARYGNGTPDRAGLDACAKLKSGLSKLSAERMRQEMLKLLEAPRAVPTLKVMAARGVLRKIIPHTDDWRAIERLPGDGLLRLFVLAKHPVHLKDQFRLSNEQAKRIEALNDAPDVSPRLTRAERQRLVYAMGQHTWHDAVALSHARSRAKRDDAQWLALRDVTEPPRFPLSGSDLLAHGIKPGPEVGRILHGLEDWWLASDFKPGKEELLKRISK
jgi:poly(A) polymerase